MNLLGLRPDATKVNARYLFHLLRSHDFRKQIPRITNDSVNQSSFSITNFKRLRLPLPALPAQKRIAAILDKADAIRRQREQAVELCRTALRANVHHLLGDPRSNGEERRVPLESLVEPTRPITYGILKPGPDIPGGVPYVRVVDIRNSLVHSESIRRTTTQIAGEYKRSALKTGDILLSIRGHVGRLGIVPPTLDDANITQDTARIAIADGSLRDFVFWCLHSAPVQRWMQRHVKGVAVTGINLGDVRRIPIPVESASAVRRFSMQQRKLLETSERMVAAAVKAASLFSALVQRAFRGEL
jgi:type I restriction enzyme S subunit